MHIQQQMLRYQRHEETIKVLGKALDLLGHKDTQAAIEVLMAYRNHLQHQQKPVVEAYRQEAHG